MIIISFAFLLLPFLFLKSMMKYFTRKATVSINGNSFSIITHKIANDEDYKSETYYLDNISSYGIQFPNDRFASIILNLKNSKKIEYSFIQKRLEESQDDTGLVIDSFHQLIKDYNNKQPEVGNIHFVPSFFATKKGLFSIIILVILLFITISLTIYLHKNIPATFLLSIALVGGILMKRRNDLLFYKKMK